MRLRPVLDRLFARPASRRARRPGTPARRLQLGTLEDRVVPTGTWTQLTNPIPSHSPDGSETMLLLTDGTVLAQGGGGATGGVNDNSASLQWFKLTPDSDGSYVGGTWSPATGAGSVAPMGLERLFYASNVLKDGRVFVYGGEYSGPSTAKTFVNSGEIYDPVANTWTPTASLSTVTKFGDDPTMLLPDGKVLAGYISDNRVFVYDPVADSWTEGTTTSANAKLNSDASDEETWVKLADGSILTYNVNVGGGSLQNAQRFDPTTNTWIASGNVPVQLETTTGKELGAALLLPDGRVFFIGGTSNNALYTPSTTATGTGSWVAAPSTPGSLGGNDSPGVMMPNGHVLYAAGVTPGFPSSGNVTSLFEYDPTPTPGFPTGTITAVPTPAAFDLTVPAFETRMLMLPSGDVLFSNSTDQLWVFTPDGAPLNEWRPTISSIVDNGGGTFTLTGTQLNGLSGGASYGDDAEMDSNYPLVRLTHDYTILGIPFTDTLYARTFNWSSTGVQTGATPVSTQFTLPGGHPLSYFNTITVVANGIPSATVPFHVNPNVTGLSNQGATEQSAQSFSLGTFNDPDDGPWSLDVDWGDGANLSISPVAPGSYSPQSHTYTEEGTKIVTVTVTDSSGRSGSGTFLVTVTDPPVAATGGFLVNDVEGADSGSQTVARFTDPAGAESVSNYGAQIDWGDGTAPTAGTISESGGTFTVSGSHTYGEEGGYTVAVTINHEGIISAATSAATVTDPPVQASSVAFSAVEGTAFVDKTVATFTDPGGPEAVGDYSANIDWGDGTASVGTISLSGGTFTVSGSHTYAEESAGDHPGSNPYDVTVTIGHELTTAQVVLSHAHVTDPPVDATGGFTFVAVEGDPSATQTVATFTDPGGAEVLADYSAVIDWGDGTTSVGAITFGGALGSKTDAFTVSGSHTYAVGLAEPGEFGNTFCDADPPSYHKPITVTVTHEGIVAVPAVSDAKISLKPGTAHLTKLGSLIVVGTPADDTIVVNNVGGKTRTVTVQLGSSVLGTFTVSASGRIVVAAMGGNDSVQVAGGITVQSVQYGGPGNDRLKGGGGRNILIGCDGDDTLTAGNLGDLLVGGAGADRLVGGNGNDLLVSALLVDGLNNEDDGYTDLVTILTTGSIPAPLHVLDDGVVDKLTGGGGTDTAYYNFTGVGVLDIATDGLEIGIDI
jgi:hypothetical protein